VAKRIAEIAVEVDGDVIVVGTRGHSAFSGAILGSITQRLLHFAHCPVLAVPPLGQSPVGATEADELATARESTRARG
jgi:nucleotide-binding universal stress UspA family protein